MRKLSLPTWAACERSAAIRPRASSAGGRSADPNEPPEKISEASPSEGCERCDSPADGPTPVDGLQTVEEVRGSWGEEKRRLIAAGCEPKERCGRIIWKRPDLEAPRQWILCLTGGGDPLLGHGHRVH